MDARQLFRDGGTGVEEEEEEREGGAVVSQ